MTAALPPKVPRCWCADSWETGGVHLSSSEVRHLQKVRRVREGEEVCVLNGKGDLGFGVFQGGGEITFEEILHVPPPDPQISLYMGALKHAAWEEVLRHATELGASRLIRVETAHTVSRLEGKVDRKLERWKEILVEACKQSANPWIPELILNDSVKEAVQDPHHPNRGMVAVMDGQPWTVGECLQESLGHSIALWIGPEGDFTPEESALLQERGLSPVTLGTTVLRAETAALSLLSRLRLHR